ncbi:hypothetical protein [Geodermatophilus nigrescens]|uniref:Uncharacterized protein n=1 Tax=Geodermatophilus nigrescens TaxID=1070870 RepID=A0A1M5NRK2_9ACTN|nr:hypothetical protein [Geodermatophilus nigrescens]SHG91819.1 hypothetical protein SAMN05444351_3653 [Geodermatophilus nigrescens]
MTVTALPSRGRWVWDARDRTRAVRVSAHAAQGLLNLSIWRDDVCVGTVKLRPDEAADLVSGLSEGLAQLAAAPARPVPVDARVLDLETRLAAVESAVGGPTGAARRYRSEPPALRVARALARRVQQRLAPDPRAR